MKYRSRTDIINLILEIVSQGAHKTKIMYNAYLSYTQINEYMSLLLENKLIKKEEGTGLYRLTEKGHRFYLECKELLKMMETKEETQTTPFDTKNGPRLKRMRKVYRFRG